MSCSGDRLRPWPVSRVALSIECATRTGHYGLSNRMQSFMIRSTSYGVQLR